MDHKTWIVKFWDRVDQKGPDDCWLWTGGRVGRRGILKTPSGHKVLAHVAAWLMARNRRVPQGYLVDQDGCREGLCCNPSHLSLVVRRAGARTAVTGERNGRAKLSDDQVSALRGEYAVGGVTQQSLAAKYGISQGQVSRIVKGSNR